ncbi:Clavaminate synthase-like protein [Phlegmacium glaucopus]|nr:Clavaminate synthase-like protein [Phlegmacium glaucopus]
MNALQDPTKKPSINSLLNPQETSTFPSHLNSTSVGANHAQNQSHQPSSMFHYAPVPSYNLRAASWDPDDDPHKRRPLNGGNNAPRHYQQHPTLPPPPPSHVYADAHASRLMMRHRIDDSPMYAGEGHVWHPKQPPPPPQQQQQHHQQHHQHAVSGMSYTPPVIYSDQRTTLSGDYQPQSNYSSTYGDQSTPSSNEQLWQQAERVSVRLAARGTLSEQQQQQASQDARYAASSYYNHPNLYSPPTYSPQQLQPLQLPQQLVVPETAQILSESTSSSTRLSSSSTSSSSKRQLPEDESTPAPKVKRAKAKTKSGTPGSTPATAPGPSKRGYNAKKRTEAALITAQNDALQRASASNETYLAGSSNGPALASTTNTTTTVTANATTTDPNNALTHLSSVALVPELQYARCMSNRYRGELFSRCVSCTRRWAGDTCRFQGIRYLLRGLDKRIACVSFREHHQTVEPPTMDFPTEWNRKFKKEHMTRTKLSIAKALLPTLKLEREHLKAEELVRRPRESDVRATCDTCMTSLFSASWMCRVCGREVCHECFIQVRELTSEPLSASPAELAALQGKREKHAHSNPFFLSCNKRAEHGVGEFTPVTRFWDKELEKAIEEMEDILKGVEEGGLRRRESMEDIRRNGRHGYDSNGLPSSPLSSPPCSDPAVATRNDNTKVVYDSYLPCNLSPRVASIPVYRLQQIPASLYDPVPSAPPSSSHRSKSPSSSSSPPPSFSCLWTLGIPILVKDVLPRFKLKWTPDYFMQQYGEQSCLIIECQTDMNKRVTVKEFFGWFGKYEERIDCWKLKDWPPSTDFKTAFPELYEDFSQAVPVPDYVRRDGVFNLGSHFPSNTIAPDLGPKMYNSLASSQEPGSKGSTRLHMDMADALNVMLYASKCEDGTEGYAVWDLFRAEDSDKLRMFLRRKFGQGQNGLGALSGGGGGGGVVIAHDPIHGQQFYLDVDLRKALYDECGVKSYRVYQRPGDGVFIPAGCAHQVANMSDCMKIAIDFVSPENIDRCEKLTQEFREQNQSKVWKEDVLQLRTMMWFAWQSCCLQESIKGRN